MFTFDRATIDSTGAFLIGELERLDPTLHEPLVSVTWTRDITLREDVSIADETSSFTNSSFAAAGGINPNGKALVGKNSNAITGVSLDIGKTANPLYLWAMELSYSLPELLSAQKLGRPVDQQKFAALKLKHQMDVDEMVYTGDTTVGCSGLLNNGNVSVITASTDTNSHTTWAQKISDDTTGNVAPNEILADVNALLNAVWQNSGWAVCPSELRIPPAQFSLLVSQKVSSAGNISILEFLKLNSISNSINGRPLNVQPLKWAKQAGASSADRMVAYTNDPMRVRYPLVPLQRTALENRSIYQATSYFGRLGVLEVVYPETVGYCDGI